jgi:outer membrane protein assembly factor BamA
MADTNVNGSQVYQTDSSAMKVEFGEVIITGYKKTKPYIIQREVPFKKGMVVPRSELDKLLVLARQQIMNTSLFVDVTISVINEIAGVVYVNVQVKERWYLFPIPYFRMIDRNFNTWWVENKRSLERVNYGFKFNHNNVSGRNDKLNIWLVGGYTQQASIRYENPFLDKDLKHGMNVGFSYSRNREINYATSFNKQLFYKEEDDYLLRQSHIDIGYSYRPGIKTRHNITLGYTDMLVKDTVFKLNPEFFPSPGINRLRFPDLTYSVQYYNVDYIPYPLRGFMGDAYVYKRFGAGDKLAQIGAKGTYTTRIAPKSYLQFQASGIIRLPGEQPFVNLRLFGSSNLYMRGLEYYVIDGASGGLVRGTAIREMLNFSLPSIIKSKTHDKIPVKIYLKTFGDVGYSYHPNAGNSVFNNKLLRTWGIGLDVVTFYDIVFKLEYSFNQLNERGLFIHTASDF